MRRSGGGPGGDEQVLRTDVVGVGVRTPVQVAHVGLHDGVRASQRLGEALVQVVVADDVGVVGVTGERARRRWRR